MPGRGAWTPGRSALPSGTSAQEVSVNLIQPFTVPILVDVLTSTLPEMPATRHPKLKSYAIDRGPDFAVIAGTTRRDDGMLGIATVQITLSEMNAIGRSAAAVVDLIRNRMRDLLKALGLVLPEQIAEFTCIGGPWNGERRRCSSGLGVLRVPGPGRPVYYILQTIQPGNLPEGQHVHVLAHEAACTDDYAAMNCRPVFNRNGEGRL